MMDITAGAARSDLFFNHEHPNYDRVMKGAGEPGYTLTEVEQRDALLTDAREFCETVERAFGITYAPEDVVNDFLGRL